MSIETTKDRFVKVNKLIKQTDYGFGNIIINTFIPKVKKRKTDDKLYLDNPFLVEALPRACSLINVNGTPIGYIMGMRKFTGYTKQDDDDISDFKDNINTNNLFSFETVLEWQKKNELRVFRSDKENGKLAVLKIFNYHGRKLLVFGSKNRHIPVWLDEIESYIPDNGLTGKIFIDVKNNLEKIKKLQEIFKDDFTLCGEFCDGKHFTPGDNTIYWFGLFKDGLPLENDKFNFLMGENGLQTSDSEEIEINTETNLENILKMSRTFNNEGSVIYFYHTKSEQRYLVKTKSVRYIFMRMFRQILLRGSKFMFQITKRVNETKDYHNLNSTGAAKITNQLLEFGKWIILNKINTNLLGFSANQKNESLGFYHFWNRYITETGNDDINVEMEDFGDFDKKEYLDMIIYPYCKFSILEKPQVIFIQGLQGSGKSYLTDEIIKKNSSFLKVEQDEFEGNTLATQGFMFHHLMGLNPEIKYVIVSRCNINKIQYQRYLDIAYECSCPIKFFSPQNLDKTYLLTSYCGILTRSKDFNNLKLGSSILPNDKVYYILLNNFKEFERPKEYYSFEIYKDPIDLEEINLYNFIQVHEYCLKNLDLINNNRFDINKIIELFMDKILNGYHNFEIDKSKISYVGFFINDEDKLELMKFISNHNKYRKSLGTFYVDHITQVFYGNGKQNQDFEPFTNNEMVDIHLENLVIRKSDGACAYSAKVFVDGIKINFQNRHSHLTGFMPEGIPPVESNKFVGLRDDSVEIIPINKMLSGICRYV